MSWSEIGELLKVLGAVATACAAWFAAVTAYRGLEKWRIEARGKRRADLAASVLAAVYRMEEILRDGRASWVMPHEMGKRPGVPESVAENTNYVPEARLQQHEEFFAQLRTMRHEYAAVFGRDAAGAIDDLWRVRIDINHAVDSLIRHPTVRDDDKDQWKEWRDIAFRPLDEKQDPTRDRISAAVVQVEAVCRPGIEARDGA